MMSYMHENIKLERSIKVVVVVVVVVCASNNINE